MNGMQTITPQQANTEVQSFIKDLIDKRFDGQKLSTEEEDKLQKLLFDQLGIFILESVYEKLPKEKQEEFKKLLEEKKSQEELREYAAKHIKQYDEFLLDVMLDFEDAYLAGVLDPQDPMRMFINDLIDRKKFTNLTPEQRDDIFSDIAQRLDEFIMALSLSQFSQEEIAQFKQLLAEKKSQGELQQFAIEHIADYPKFLDETLLKFQEAYLA